MAMVFHGEGSNAPFNFQQIEEFRLYDTAFVAALTGLQESTLRKAAGGFRGTPIPKITRVGRSVRFLGRNILLWLEDPNSERGEPQAAPATKPMKAPGAGRPRGRPRKMEADRGRI